MNIGFLTSGNYVKAERIPVPKGERSPEGGAWCVTLLPLAGLWLQDLAVDKYSGAVLWLLVIVLIWAGCFADFKQIKERLTFEQAEKLKKVRIIPPLYIFKRDKLRTGEGYRGIVLGILMAAAVFGNGFTQGLKVNGDSVIKMLERTHVTTLDNFTSAQNSSATISEQLKEWFDDGYKTSCTHKGEIFSVVFSGKHDGSPAEVTIDVRHDGFIFRSVRAASVELGERTYKDDELKKVLEKIFLVKTESDDSGTTEEETAESTGG